LHCDNSLSFEHKAVSQETPPVGLNQARCPALFYKACAGMVPTRDCLHLNV